LIRLSQQQPSSKDEEELWQDAAPCSSNSIDLTGILTTNDPALQDATLCTAPCVVGLTHIDAQHKESVTAQLRSDDRLWLALEITTVGDNNDQVSEFAYSKYYVQFVNNNDDDDATTTTTAPMKNDALDDIDEEQVLEKMEEETVRERFTIYDTIRCYMCGDNTREFPQNGVFWGITDCAYVHGHILPTDQCRRFQQRAKTTCGCKNMNTANSTVSGNHNIDSSNSSSTVDADVAFPDDSLPTTSLPTTTPPPSTTMKTLAPTPIIVSENVETPTQEDHSNAIPFPDIALPTSQKTTTTPVPTATNPGSIMIISKNPPTISPANAPMTTTTNANPDRTRSATQAPTNLTDNVFTMEPSSSPTLISSLSPTNTISAAPSVGSSVGPSQMASQQPSISTTENSPLVPQTQPPLDRCPVNVTFGCETSQGLECHLVTPPEIRTCSNGTSITEVSMSYRNVTCDIDQNKQGNQAFCNDTAELDYETPKTVQCVQQDGIPLLVEPSYVLPGYTFTIRNPSGAPLPPKVACRLVNPDGTQVQFNGMDFSGSVDLNLGDQFGAFQLESCDNLSCTEVLTYLVQVRNEYTSSMSDPTASSSSIANITKLDVTLNDNTVSFLNQIPINPLPPNVTTGVEPKARISICGNHEYTADIVVEVSLGDGKMTCRDTARYNFLVQSILWEDAPIPSASPSLNGNMTAPSTDTTMSFNITPSSFSPSFLPTVEPTGKDGHPLDQFYWGESNTTSSKSICYICGGPARQLTQPNAILKTYENSTTTTCEDVDGTALSLSQCKHYQSLSEKCGCTDPTGNTTTAPTGSVKENSWWSIVPNPTPPISEDSNALNSTGNKNPTSSNKGSNMDDKDVPQVPSFTPSRAPVKSPNSISIASKNPTMSIGDNGVSEEGNPDKSPGENVCFICGDGSVNDLENPDEMLFAPDVAVGTCRDMWIQGIAGLFTSDMCGPIQMAAAPCGCAIHDTTRRMIAGSVILKLSSVSQKLMGLSLKKSFEDLTAEFFADGLGRAYPDLPSPVKNVKTSLMLQHFAGGADWDADSDVLLPLLTSIVVVGSIPKDSEDVHINEALVAIVDRDASIYISLLQSNGIMPAFFRFVESVEAYEPENYDRLAGLNRPEDETPQENSGSKLSVSRYLGVILVLFPCFLL
jgi:hypothetical protein